jgi:hypothetical protein
MYEESIKFNYSGLRKLIYLRIGGFKKFFVGKIEHVGGGTKPKEVNKEQRNRDYFHLRQSRDITVVVVDCRGQGGPRRGVLRRCEGGVHAGGGDGVPSGSDGDGVRREGRRHHTGPVRARQGEDVILHDNLGFLFSHPATASVVWHQ